MKIGLSISLCISDIIKGVVNEKDVKKIIGSTSAAGMKDWEEIIIQYRRFYWQDNPDLG
jgi:hypothetical protein